jgi:hypothetical protein
MATLTDSAIQRLNAASSKGQPLSPEATLAASVSVEASIASTTGAKRVRVLRHLAVAIVDADPAATPAQASVLFATMTSSLKAHPDIAEVEADIHVYSFGVPNDPYWSALWGMDRVNVLEAMDAFTTGNRDVVVAVIDSGSSAARLCLNLLLLHIVIACLSPEVSTVRRLESGNFTIVKKKKCSVVISATFSYTNSVFLQKNT